MKKLINGTKKLISNNGNVNFYIKQGTNTVVDIDVKPHVKTVVFSSIGYTGNLMFALCNVRKQFPDVEEIRIDAGIYLLEISNMMFPNVKKVISHSNSFQSDSTCLIKNGCGGRILKNTFCKPEGEAIDLKDIHIIEDYALEGCKSHHLINSDSIRACTNFSFRGYSCLILPDNDKSIISINDTIMLDVNGDKEVVDIPSTINVISLSAKFCSQKVIVHSIDTLSLFTRQQKSDISVLEFAADNKIEPFEFITVYSHYFEFNAFAVSADNPYYTSVDGVIYTKDMKLLVCGPRSRTQHLDIPEGVEYISDYAFLNGKITSVSIPSSVKEIGRSAFQSCNKLEHVSLGGTQVIKPYAFANCCKLQELTIPESVRIICNNAFAASGLTELQILEGITNIDSFAFAECNISNIVIPKSLLFIGAGNFHNTKSFTLSSYTHGLITSVTPNSGTDYKGYTEIQTFTFPNGKTLYLPAILTREMASRIDAYLSCRQINDEYIEKAYECAVSSAAKQDIAIQMYKYLKLDSIASYLRRVGNSILKRKIQEKDEEGAIEFVQLGLTTKNTLKSALKKANLCDLTLLSAYLLSYINQSDDSKTSFRL